MAVGAILVKLTSRGPALYRQVRMGQGGRHFTLFKLRTMRQDAEAATGPVWSTENDPRITPLGHLLRRTHIDEFPQLWNVLRGEMSLVETAPRASRIRRPIGLGGSVVSRTAECSAGNHRPRPNVSARRRQHRQRAS